MPLLSINPPTNEIDRLMAVNCGPKRIMAQGISIHGPIDTRVQLITRINERVQLITRINEFKIEYN